TATALAAGLGVLPAIHTPRKRAAAPPVNAVPIGFTRTFQPDSFTAVSEFTWWLYGTRPCGRGVCPAIARTTNGGVTFTWVPAPRGANGGYQMRFADPQDGYIFGSKLWTTDNGGATWQRVPLGGSVVELAASYPYVYAIVLGQYHGRLVRSRIGSDQWKTLKGAGYAANGLWVQGSDVLVDAAGSQAEPEPGIGSELMISHDAGRRFARRPLPRSNSCMLQDAAPNVVWAACASAVAAADGGNFSGGIWRSTDDGRSFGAVAARGGPDLNDGAFSADGPDEAVVGYQQLYRTLDGGATFARVPTPRGIEYWDYIGFTDPTHGVALGTFRCGARNCNRLYYTINAGTSYHYVPIDPA
ncbi:MAG TPA: hypothetical protein VME01_03870, partial [Solirubrobacteraceae bacterium]|nr:hypothetical protein [Solirubrobacteraceae bacterium]